MAFHTALQEFQAEGGVSARASRYKANHRVLSEGMAALGFEAYLEPQYQSYIITSYR